MGVTIAISLLLYSDDLRINNILKMPLFPRQNKAILAEEDSESQESMQTHETCSLFPMPLTGHLHLWWSPCVLITETTQNKW